MKSQVLVSFLRWAAIGILVAAGSAIADILAGQDYVKSILKGIGIALPIWLGALGWGGFDSHRAELVRKSAVLGASVEGMRPYDVGYHLIDEIADRDLKYEKFVRMHTLP
jgi:hypothetical protein